MPVPRFRCEPCAYEVSALRGTTKDLTLNPDVPCVLGSDLQRSQISPSAAMQAPVAAPGAARLPAAACVPAHSARLRSEGICSTSQPNSRHQRLATKAEPPSFRGSGEIAGVQALEGVRVQLDDAQQPVVEYLVHWKVCGGSMAPKVTHTQLTAARFCAGQDSSHLVG